MEWAIWGLQGSYYVRNGQTNFVESFGVLKPDWSDWQNSTFSAALGNMWKQTQGP
jgi:endoglucanase